MEELWIMCEGGEELKWLLKYTVIGIIILALGVLYEYG